MKVRFQLAAGTLAGMVLVAGAPTAGAGGLQPQGAEFPLTRGIPGDQVNPVVALRSSGGLFAWQDAATDGDGLGITGVRLSADGSAIAGSTFRINEAVAGDQENPVLSSLGTADYFAAWQSGTPGFQHIVGRVIGADGSFKTGDLAVSSGNGEHQIDPSVAALTDGSVVVVWSSFRQDGGTGYDAYGRIFGPDGKPRGGEFLINETRGLGRRSPAVTGTAGGGFLAVWVSERQSGVRDFADSSGRPLAGIGAPVFDVRIVARAFTSEGAAAGTEQVVSEPGAVAANPVVTRLGTDSAVVAWTRRSPTSATTRFDIACRTVDGAGAPAGAEHIVNNELTGDQYRPRLASTLHGVVAVWTSMGQDGSWEGVFGRWLNSAGEPVGDDIPVNTQLGGGQVLPSIAADSEGGLLVAWSSNLPRTGYEVFAQRLAPLLLKVRPEARGALRLEWPTVSGGVYQIQASRDGFTWSAVGGPRAAAGANDGTPLPASGQMLLYRVVRVR